MSKTKRPALGRGLGALLPPKPGPSTPSEKTAPAAEERPADDDGPRVRSVGIEQLKPSPDQPRKHFEPRALEELAESIKHQGIIQPIVASVANGEDGQRSYTIIAGERRWRAAQKAGLQTVPVVVREVSEEDRLELALIENIQRADLNPIEEAQAYAELIRIRGYTQEELATRVGKDRSSVANSIRLLRLPPKVQTMVREGRLSMGHARALLGLEHEDDMNAVAAEVVDQKLSVRATEAAVRKRAQPEPAPKRDEEAHKRKVIVEELEHRLRRRLGVRVRLKPKAGKKGAGTVELPYGSLDELDRLLKIMLGS